MRATRAIVDRGKQCMGFAGWGVTRLWIGVYCGASAMLPYADSGRWAIDKVGSRSGGSKVTANIGAVVVAVIVASAGELRVKGSWQGQDWRGGKVKGGGEI